MNKKFTKLIAALALLAFMTPTMAGWGQTREEVTYTFSSHYSVDTELDGVAIEFNDNITATFNKGTGSNNPKYYTNGSAVRWYAKGTLLINASNATISEIVISYTRNDNSVSADGGSYSHPTGVGDGTWTGSASSVTFTQGGTSGQDRISTIAVTYTSSGGPTTYTVTYDANGGTGTMTDSNSPYTAGATVTVLDNEFTRENYAFNHWNTAADDSGTSYDEGDEFTINANTTLYAQWNENGGGSSSNTQVLTFSLTSNPGGWPTANSTTLTNYTYTLNNVAYTFALKNVKCNSGYLMMTSTAVLGLPAIEGYKLTKVVASNSSSCSTSTNVGISSSSSSASYISGGAIQTWSTQGSTYTYNLTSTEANTMYYLYVTDKNAQVTQLELTYEYVAPSTDPAINVDSELAVTPVAVANGELAVTYDNIEPTSGTITLFDAQDNDITSSCTWFTPAFNADFSKVTYTATENISGAVNSVRMHLNVSDGTDSAEADVAVTQDFILTTMDQILIRATANGSTEKDVTIYFNNWVISGVNHSSYQYATKAWLTDGTKGCVVACTNSSYSKFMVNDKLNGKVTCKLKLNTGFAQISSLVSGNDGTTATPGLTVTNDGTPVNPVTGATIAGLSAVNTGSVVAFTGLTCQSSSYNYSTGYTLTDGTNTIYVKRNVYSFELTNEATYNVTGVFENNTTGKFIYPRSPADISEVTIPAISVTSSLSSFTYCVGEGPSAAQAITVSGSDLEGNITLALNDGNESDFEISLDEDDNYTNTLTLTQTSGTVGETTIYVRMKAGLAIANDYADEINLNSTNATAKTVSLAGTVTPLVVTWDLRTNSYSSASTTEVDWTSSYVNMTLTKGTSGTNANNALGGGDNPSGGTYDHTRFYQNQNLTFTPQSGYAISSIVITAVSGNVAGFTGNTWTNATAETSGTTVTITPTNVNNACSVVISAACRATAVTVYYEESTLEPHDITNSIYMVNGTVVASHSSAVEGTIVTLTVYPAAGYHLENVGYIDVVLSATPGTSVAITQVNDGTFTFTMPDEDVTVLASFTEYSGTYYTLVNSADDLIPGRHYIIASSKNAGAAYAMGAQNGSYREQVAVNVVGNFIYGKPYNLREVVLSGDDTNLWTLYDDGTGVASQGYLYAVSGNGLKCRTDNTSNDNGKWTISITEGVATIVSQISGTDVSNTIKYNAGSSRFSCYTPSSGMSLVYLFMKADETDYEFYSNTTFDDLTIGELDIYTVHSPATLEVTGTLSNEGNHDNLIIEDGGQLITSSTGVQATVQKNITGYGDDNNVKTGWNFIASPLSSAYTLTGTDMVSGNGRVFDLYRLNNTIWENYKNNEHSDFTALDNGTGYLYASSNDITLSFAGAIKPFTTTGNANQVALADGWNLVGNPYTFNVYSNKSYYTITTENGENVITAVTSASDYIAPCTGIVVKSTGASSVAFTEEAATSWATGNQGNIQMTLAQQASNRGNATTLDNAIVSFNEGEQLEKFYFGTQNANLYIPQGTEEYAIVSSEAQGEMPVNFRANANGQYTLTVNAEDVEMNYLHLIDNMTGADVDLLATPSYTFNAKTTDYESRFKLVFASSANGNENGNENFAFFSNGNLIVNNSGEATLQVIDITGRIVSSQRISGSCSTQINAVTGVYMLRLINGNDVKVQKMVVR